MGMLILPRESWEKERFKSFLFGSFCRTHHPQPFCHHIMGKENTSPVAASPLLLRFRYILWVLTFYQIDLIKIINEYHYSTPRIDLFLRGLMKFIQI